MIQIRQGLDRLTADLVELRDSMMWQQVDPAPYLRQLDKVVEDLKAKSDRVLAPKSPLDAEKVWVRWRELAFDLTKLDRREIRALCVSPKTAMTKRLANALSENPEPLRRWINLHGFVQAYFGQWRSMENPEVIETLIQTALSGSTKVRRGRILDLWGKSLFLFSSEASRRFGRIIIKEHKSILESCTEYCIEPTSAMARAAQEYAAVAAVELLIQHDARLGQAAVVRELQWISTNLLTSSLSPDCYRDAASKLIMSRLTEGMPLLQSALVGLVHADERLGDPRLAYCAPNWRKIPEARERFLAWLASETLQFFFDTLVPRNDTNRRRAEFWLEYAKRQGKIKDFQVAVSDEDRSKIRASRATTIPSHSSITGGKTSAFLMIFEGFGTEYVVIEFSETGNAAYIYSRKLFEARGITIRSNSFHLTDDLKRVVAAKDRIWHRINTIEPWETKAHRQLADLGIRP